jgi:hypothetical protein
MLPGESSRSSVYLLYSPNLVEGKFCEVGLPLYGVLRSSHQTWSSGIMPLWWKGPTRPLSKAAQKGGSVKRCTLQCADTRA